MTFTNTGLAAAVREGGQIDVRVDPTFVTVLVEYMNRFECRQIDRQECELQEGNDSASEGEGSSSNETWSSKG